MNQRWAEFIGYRCFLCSEKNAQSGICKRCAQALPRLPEWFCSHCSERLPWGEKGLCVGCIKQAPDFDQTWVGLSYEYPVTVLIRELKYRSGLFLVPVLVSLLYEGLKTNNNLPQAILAMPQSKQRWRSRGFNQALELARPIAKRLQLPLIDGVHRIQDRPAQASLGAHERQKNLIQAFEGRGKFPWDHVAVIDDVMTTGATLSAVAKVLKQAGVTRVTAWVLARTPPTQ